MDGFKYLGSQVAEDGGCERDVVNRMNEEYKARRALKSAIIIIYHDFLPTPGRGSHVKSD